MILPIQHVITISTCPIDFAKIGRLVLHKGWWSGEQIVNAPWINHSTQPKKSLEDGSPRKWSYNSFWYSIDKLNQVADVMAIGNYGQFMCISHKYNLIIVRSEEVIEDFDDNDWAEMFINQ